MHSKLLILALLGVFPLLAWSEEGNPPSPLVVGGFRFQTVDRGTRPDLFFAGVNLLWLKTQESDEGSFWSFASPGVQYQPNGERRLAFSISPAAYVGRSGLSFATQIFPFDSGRTGGALGFSVGYHFF